MGWWADCGGMSPAPPFVHFWNDNLLETSQKLIQLMPVSRSLSQWIWCCRCRCFLFLSFLLWCRSKCINFMHGKISIRLLFAEWKKIVGDPTRCVSVAVCIHPLPLCPINAFGMCGHFTPNSTQEPNNLHKICFWFAFFSVSLSVEKKPKLKCVSLDSDDSIQIKWNNWHLYWYTIWRPWAIRHFVVRIILLGFKRRHSGLSVSYIWYTIHTIYIYRYIRTYTHHTHTLHLRRVWKITRWHLRLIFSSLSLSLTPYLAQVSNLLANLYIFVLLLDFLCCFHPSHFLTLFNLCVLAQFDVKWHWYYIHNIWCFYSFNFGKLQECTTFAEWVSVCVCALHACVCACTSTVQCV